MVIFVDVRVARATAKFHEMGRVLKDKEVSMGVRRKLLESCVRPRLIYATQSWWPKERQLKKLEACWYSFLRQMVKGGYKRKPSEPEMPDNFALHYTNKDLEGIIKIHPLRDIITTQYLKYIAHVCRRPNTNFTKLSLFFIPKKKYYRDPWIRIAKLLGDISPEQAKRETQSRAGFTRLLNINVML